MVAIVPLVPLSRTQRLETFFHTNKPTYLPIYRSLKLATVVHDCFIYEFV